MRLIRRAAVFGAAAMLAAGLVSVVSQLPAQGHGTPMSPGSRTFLCWKDGLSQQGDIQPHNPACTAAVQQGGTNPLYNWFSVLRSDAAGRTVGLIADGQLCSGGNATFAAYNQARNDWPLTHLTAGARFDFKYSNWAHHPGTFYFYVTKDSWSPTRALAWNDLESTPFLTVTNPPQNGGPGTNEGHYYFSGNLPSNKSGRHLIYSRWVRSDSNENFFGCSDVTFDGGNGQVTGVGPGSENPTDPGGPTPTTGPTPTPTAGPTTPAPSGDCMAVYKIIGSWNGGFQAEVEIMNHSTRTYGGWTASWAWPSGQTLAQVWNGTSTVSGTNVTVRNASWNGSVAPNGRTTFGFLGTHSGTNTLPAVTCVGS
ncbi:chitin-binding protein [Asanoa hainanensis]|uniref:Chitin-binding protein n=2 Tax=Asanoa hainanensis TaxID=560556 RepID=A0A239P7B2_9ACTN|nr:chitin-binding protein [Asanoa hainanensis]